MQWSISGLVFFTIRWWDPAFFEAMHPEGTPRRASWPYVESKYNLWTWLFVVPLVAYFLWQTLYFLIVDVLRRQRLLRDPEVMTSYRWYLHPFYDIYILTALSTFIYSWQRTVKEGTESKQCMVASKWASWGSEPVVHVHSSSSYVHSGNNSAHCSHIFVLQNAYYLSNLQSLCNCLERRKLSAGSDAQTIHSKREEEEIRNSARQAR